MPSSFFFEGMTILCSNPYPFPLFYEGIITFPAFLYPRPFFPAGMTILLGFPYPYPLFLRGYGCFSCLPVPSFLFLAGMTILLGFPYPHSLFYEGMIAFCFSITCLIDSSITAKYITYQNCVLSTLSFSY